MSISLHNVYYARVRQFTGREGRRVGRWKVVQCAKEAPSGPGCYAVYHDAHLVYVGSSLSLRRRVRKYFPGSRRRQDNGGSAQRQLSPTTSVIVKVAGSRREGDWLMREHRLIRRLRPRDNRVLYGGKLRSVKPAPVLRCNGCEAGHIDIHAVVACEKAAKTEMEWDLSTNKWKRRTA